MNSGTDALRFAYLALGVKPHGEIVTVAHTFIATTESISQAGGAIRFVDIDDETMTIDPDAVQAAIGPDTVGLVPVHLYGQPANLDPLLQVAANRGLWLVEDAAQAHGAKYRGKRVGTFGDLSCFSFYPGKNLGSGLSRPHAALRIEAAARAEFVKIWRVLSFEWNGTEDDRMMG